LGWDSVAGAFTKQLLYSSQHYIILLHMEKDSFIKTWTMDGLQHNSVCVQTTNSPVLNHQRDIS
ncbi:hypothetical protein J4Q44_G00182630, partial [Coregonus suidteri]